MYYAVCWNTLQKILKYYFRKVNKYKCNCLCSTMYHINNHRNNRNNKIQENNISVLNCLTPHWGSWTERACDFRNYSWSLCTLSSSLLKWGQTECQTCQMKLSLTVRAENQDQILYSGTVKHLLRDYWFFSLNKSISMIYHLKEERTSERQSPPPTSKNLRIGQALIRTTLAQHGFVEWWFTDPFFSLWIS